MKTIKIEKNVPIPPHRGCGRWRALLPQMVAGDCVALSKSSEVQSLLNAARRLGIRVTSRKVDEPNAAYRVWRVK